MKTQQNTPSEKESNLTTSKSNKSKSGKNNQMDTPSRARTNQEHLPSRILIIGDSIHSGINPKGLKNNVFCQTYPGATLSTLTENIQIYDLNNYKDIIVYVAGIDASQDHWAGVMLSENLETEYIEEMYDKLSLLIQEKTPTINIYLCSICPRGDADVYNVNSVIKDLSDFHSCVFLVINKTFYNKYDDLNHIFTTKRLYSFIIIWY